MDRPGLHADGGGLYLHVAQGGTKTWAYRYRQGGRQHVLGLGSIRALSLADARRKAADLARRKLEGEVLLVGRRRAASVEGQSFEAALKGYLDAKQAGWKGDRQRREIEA